MEQSVQGTLVPAVATAVPNGVAGGIKTAVRQIYRGQPDGANGKA